MNCPSCSAAMTTLTLQGHLDTSVELDFCPTCQVIWFDHLEDIRLAPAGTLQLFKTIGGHGQASPPPISQTIRCPRCDLRLLITEDRQRNTPFQYWRCPRGHGRLITFLNFLREKDFIRPLSPQQLAELRQNVQTINCSNCGAPIDLVHASACAHCGTPISMIDVKQIQQMAGLASRPGPAQPGDPATSAAVQAASARLPPQEIGALFDALRAYDTGGPSSTFGLVEAGLWMISRWLA